MGKRQTCRERKRNREQREGDIEGLMHQERQTNVDQQEREREKDRHTDREGVWDRMRGK